MIGILLISISTLLGEFTNSFGKKKVADFVLSKYSIGFIQMTGVLFYFVAISLLKEGAFVFQLASLKTFGPRLVLEVLQVHAMLTGLVKADRSTFSFIRVGTVPLLLLMDIVLGYSMSLAQVLGMILVVFSFGIIFLGRDIGKEGIGWVVFTTLNAVATLSLYKYDITHYNSVIGEQSIIRLALLTYLLIMAVYYARENPLKFFKKPVFLLQSIVTGLSDLAGSFAYVFAPASVIVSGKRSSEALWATLSGGLYFREKRLIFKLFIVFLLAAGLLMLIF